MNFLEELAAEYMQVQGFLVTRNHRFGLRKAGGYAGEFDLGALNRHKIPLELFGRKVPSGAWVHVETSADSHSWAKRKARFHKKFESAKPFYRHHFGKAPRRRVVIVGFAQDHRRHQIGSGIELLSIPQLMREIVGFLQEFYPLKTAVPEGYPLLRAIQYSIWFGDSDVGARFAGWD